MAANDDLIDIYEVARIMDASIHTVRDYKKRGLVRIADKRGNKDLYSKVDIIRRHSVIDQKRREGYTLAQISTMVEGDCGRMS